MRFQAIESGARFFLRSSLGILHQILLFCLRFYSVIVRVQRFSAVRLINLKKLARFFGLVRPSQLFFVYMSWWDGTLSQNETQKKQKTIIS